VLVVANDGVSVGQVEAVMRTSRALVGITAASIAEVDDMVTVPQLRVLMMMSTHGAMNLAAVAAGFQVSAPNASWIVERLLVAGLVDRRDDPSDRRHVSLTLTGDGKELIDRVIRHRRTAIRRILRTLTPRERDQVAAAMDLLATSAGEPSPDYRVALG
jgi:DNA-binding MarR family transcriptional regulator